MSARVFHLTDNFTVVQQPVHKAWKKTTRRCSAFWSPVGNPSVTNGIPTERASNAKSVQPHDDVNKWKHFPRHCGEFTGLGEFPTQRPVTRNFHVFFDLRLNKQLSKQSSGWWFETPSRPLWRHGNVQDYMFTSVSSTLRNDKVYTTVTTRGQPGISFDWQLYCLSKSAHRKNETEILKFRTTDHLWGEPTDDQWTRHTGEGPAMRKPLIMQSKTTCLPFFHQYSARNKFSVDAWEWIGNFIPHFILDVITYPCWD